MSGLRKIHLKSEEKMALLQNDAAIIFCYNDCGSIKRQVRENGTDIGIRA